GDVLEWDQISATIDNAVALQGTVTLDGVRGFPLARRLPPVQARRARIHLRSGYREVRPGGGPGHHLGRALRRTGGQGDREVDPRRLSRSGEAAVGRGPWRAVRVPPVGDLRGRPAAERRDRRPDADADRRLPVP